MSSVIEQFTGVGVALITPFTQDLSIDFNAFEKFVTEVNAHVDYLVVNGTTSEASTLTQEEKKQILDFTIKINKGKNPIMYGIGANDTNHVLRLIDETDFTNIQSVLTVSPYYNKPSQAGIIAHYEKVADHCPVPVCLYNVPGRTGSNMNAETILTLAKHPNIFGIKDASGEFEKYLAIQKHKPADFILISGDDLLTVPMISIGAKGAISVIANAYPESFTKAVHLAMEGKFDKACEIMNDFIEVNGYLYCESNPVGIKEVMAIQGKIENNVRLPLLPASAELHSAIKRTMAY